MKNKGFTLIELLVVIAIIGILASVVLASLNTARAKGADSAIKANLNNARAQAMLFYDDNSSLFTDVCTGAGGIGQFKTGATSAGSADVNCAHATSTWALEAQLKSDTAKYFCTDSTGVATTTGTSVTDGATTGDICG